MPRRHWFHCVAVALCLGYFAESAVAATVQGSHCSLQAAKDGGGVSADEDRLAACKLLPRPKLYNVHDGSFEGGGPLAYNALPDAGLSSESIKLALQQAIALEDAPRNGSPKRGLRLSIGDPGAKSNSREAYKLAVDAEDISIIGRSAAGVLMGLRTLAQLSLDGSIPHCEIIDWPDMDSRVAHICYANVIETTAYTAPDFDALIDLVDRLAGLKYNGVLLEMPGMFPYKKHRDIPCQLAFTHEQMKMLNDRLKAQHMKVIPLVQCLGHAYEILRHDKYAQYRETQDMIQQYCATNPAVLDLYTDLVDEYREVFPGISEFHIGGDEAWQLGQCPRCKDKVDKLGVGRLYADHVTAVAERIKARGMTPLLWSDMMENHMETLDMLPKCVKVVYWNYNMSKWPRPYPVADFKKAGFDLIGAPAVRFGSSGTELTIHYTAPLTGIEMLVPQMYKEGCRDIHVTNWNKSSPYDLADYGFAYAADLCWDVSVSRDDFNQRYAKVTFGLSDPSICKVYTNLSVSLPYAEPLKSHQVKRVDRLDLSAFRFPEKWQKYSSADEEPEVISLLTRGQEVAAESRKILDDVRKQVVRGDRQFELLSLAAECIEAKAKFGLAMHQGSKIASGKSDAGDAERWRKELPGILSAWKSAKKRHHRLLSETCFQPIIDFVNELMFEPAEYNFLVQLGEAVDLPGLQSNIVEKEATGK